jgi:hypothetical protein
MLEWRRYKDLYFPFLKPKSPGYRDLGLKVMYYLAKHPGKTLEELFAVVGEGWTLEAEEKLFVRRYIQKLKAHNMLTTDGDKLIPLWPFFPASAVRAVVEAHEDKLSVYFSKRTLKAWKKGERYPDLKRLMEVIM